MPLPSFLISASLITCERVLYEADNVISAIRLVDVFFSSPPPPEMVNWKDGEPFPPNTPLIQVNVIANLKAEIGHTGEHIFSLRLLNTRDEWKHYPDLPATFGGNFAEAPTQVGFVTPLQLVVRNYGNVYVCLFMDDQEVARAPITITPPPQKAQD